MGKKSIIKTEKKEKWIKKYKRKHKTKNREMTILMNKFNQLRQINHWLTWSRIKIKKAPLNIHKKNEKKKKNHRRQLCSQMSADKFENPDEMDHFSKKIQFTKVGKLKT